MQGCLQDRTWIEIFRRQQGDALTVRSAISSSFASIFVFTSTSDSTELLDDEEPFVGSVAVALYDRGPMAPRIEMGAR